MRYVQFTFTCKFVLEVEKSKENASSPEQGAARLSVTLVHIICFHCVMAPVQHHGLVRLSKRLPINPDLGLVPWLLALLSKFNTKPSLLCRLQPGEPLLAKMIKVLFLKTMVEDPADKTPQEVTCIF